MLHSSRAATRPACFLEERGEYEYCAIHGSDHCDVSHQRTVWWDAPTAAQPQLSELSVKNGGRAIAATPPRSTTAGTNSLSVSPCLCPCPPPPQVMQRPGYMKSLQAPQLKQSPGDMKGSQAVLDCTKLQQWRSWSLSRREKHGNRRTRTQDLVHSVQKGYRCD